MTDIKELAEILVAIYDILKDCGIEYNAKV